MSKIVFVNQATGYLTIDIVNAFARSGKFSDVSLLAGSVRVQDVPLDSRVTWRKIIQYNRGSPSWKFLSWFVGCFQIGWQLLFRFREYEVVYFTVPPFAYWWSAVLRNQYSLLIFDVYPDALRSFGIGPRNILFRMWESINRRLFVRAFRIYTIGEGMRELLSKYISKERVCVIPNWTGLSLMERSQARHENPFILRQNLEGKFVVQYSGNIGHTHPVEALLSVAKNFGEDSKIAFVIIGRGQRFEVLEKLATKFGLLNCRFLPFQPDKDLECTLAAADLSVVVLDDRVPTVSVPSKLYNLQAIGSAILGIGPSKSEFCQHLDKYGNGVCFAADDVAGMTSFIRRVREDKSLLKSLQDNSLKAAGDFTSANAMKYLESYVS